MHEFRGIRGPHLVMVPKTTLSNWCNEFQRWCPVLRILRFHGSKEERANIIQTQFKPGASRLLRQCIIHCINPIVRSEKSRWA